MAELDDDELEKAKETAKEWSNNCPPLEIQAQVTCKKGLAYMEHFSNEMWRQCEMRVFVMLAWKNEKGEVLFRMHDDNEALGDGDSFMKMKDWEDIEPVWQEYAQEQFSTGVTLGPALGGNKCLFILVSRVFLDHAQSDGLPFSGLILRSIRPCPSMSVKFRWPALSPSLLSSASLSVHRIPSSVFRIYSLRILLEGRAS
ncbi:hypothetical protein BDR06DRAFT_1001476 [Suillus hirtellus]|nr:hypothetical protein BDR06DRAFT_1001476 [Suillus hirtellus]